MVPAERRFPVQIRPARAAESDANIAVGYVFGDGSIAAITFSAKGHAFEGVRERMAAHRGELLLSLADFKELRADVGPDVSRTRLRLRDHGHEDAIVRSYGLSDRSPRRTEGSPAAYVWQTGQLFLKTRDALERDEPILLEAR